jgi:hypothetical protein
MQVDTSTIERDRFSEEVISSVRQHDAGKMAVTQR